jgi:hypothetical protein
MKRIALHVFLALGAMLAAAAPAAAEPPTITITKIEVTAAGGNIYWRKGGTSEWKYLPVRPSFAPTINIVSDDTATVELIQHGDSDSDVFYKDEFDHIPQQLPTSNGPRVMVNSGSRTELRFFTSSGGPYSAGYVTVSDNHG